MLWRRWLPSELIETPFILSLQLYMAIFAFPQALVLGALDDDEVVNHQKDKEYDRIGHFEEGVQSPTPMMEVLALLEKTLDLSN